MEPEQPELMRGWWKQKYDAVVDIDGVLANFIESFKRAGRTMFGTDLAWRNGGVASLEELAAESYGKENAKRLIESYFGGHGFLNVEPIGHAALFTEQLKALGFDIHIMTARPADLYPNVAKDTMSWLLGNNIKFDSLHFVKDKAKAAAYALTPLIAIEDDPVHILPYSQCCFRVYVPFQPCNIGIEFEQPNVTRYCNLLQIVQNLIDITL